MGGEIGSFFKFYLNFEKWNRKTCFLDIWFSNSPASKLVQNLCVKVYDECSICVHFNKTKRHCTHRTNIERIEIWLNGYEYDRWCNLVSSSMCVRLHELHFKDLCTIRIMKKYVEISQRRVTVSLFDIAMNLCSYIFHFHLEICCKNIVNWI